MSVLPLSICHLYPEFTSAWGDAGNVLTLRRRCDWRGLAVEVQRVLMGEGAGELSRFDLIYLGGTEDRNRQTLYSDLYRMADEIKTAVDDGAVLLSVGSGFEMLGRSFECEGEAYSGLGMFGVRTVCCSDRLVGNVVIRSGLLSTPATIVGFENHTGHTYLDDDCQPLGRVLRGAGNNGQDATEGAVCGSAFGTHLCGPLLPRNPHLADFLIRRAMRRRFGDVQLSALPDKYEWRAHSAALRAAGLEPAELDVPAF